MVWSAAEAKNRSRALSKLLRYDARYLDAVDGFNRRRWIMDDDRYVAIFDILANLPQFQSIQGHGKGRGKKRRQPWVWTRADIREIVSTSVHWRNGPRFEVARNQYGTITHVRSRQGDDDDDDAEDDDDSQAYPNASSSMRAHPQPPPWTQRAMTMQSTMQSASPTMQYRIRAAAALPWRPDPVISDPALAPSTIPAKAHPPTTIPAAKAPPPTVLPATAPPHVIAAALLAELAIPAAKAPPPVLLAPASSTIPAKAPPPILQLPAPASAMPKAAPPSVPAQAAAEPAAAPIEQQRPTCCVCLACPSTHAFIHEKLVHFIVCGVCAETYIAQNAVRHDASSESLRFCPFCREEFTAVLPVYPLQNR